MPVQKPRGVRQQVHPNDSGGHRGNTIHQGAGFQSVVADLEKLRDAGSISQDELETRLTAEDIALLDQKINPAGEYDLGAYSRFLEILIEREGGDAPNVYL